MACNGTLDIVGVVRPEDYASIKSALETSFGEEMEPGRFLFMDTWQDFQHPGVLEPYNLSWVWTTSTGDDEAPGIAYHDTAAGVSGRFAFIDGEIMVPASKIGDPVFVRQVQDAGAWIQAASFRIADSAHERVALLQRLHELRTAGTIPYPEGDEGDEGPI